MATRNYFFIFLYRDRKFFFDQKTPGRSHLDLAITNGYNQIDSGENFNECKLHYDSTGYGDGLYLDVTIESDTFNRISKDNNDANEGDVTDIISTALSEFSAMYASVNGSPDDGSAIKIINS